MEFGYPSRGNGDWQADLEGVMFAGEVFNLGKYARVSIDTGSSLISLPSKLAEKLYDNLDLVHSCKCHH